MTLGDRDPLVAPKLQEHVEDARAVANAVDDFLDDDVDAAAAGTVAPHASAADTRREWRTSLLLALLASVAYAATYWYRTPIFCLPDSYTNITVGEVAGVNITFATAMALTFSVANIVGKVTAMFALTTEFYFRRRLLVTILFFVSTTFFTGFGIAAFDPERGFLFPSPIAQIVVSAGLGAISCSALYGAVFSYIEGRQSTDVLIAAINFTLIMAGGASRSTAVALVNAGVPAYLMPAVAAGGALAVALPLLIVLDRMPRPSKRDVAQRSARGAMSCKQKLALFRHYRLVIPSLLVAYAIILGLRQYRDFFAVELYTAALGFTPSSWTYLLCDLPGALLACIIIGLMARIANHRVALAVMSGTMVGGSVLLALSAVFFDLHVVTNGTVFMVWTGVAIYCTYCTMGAPTYDRLFAQSRLDGTATLFLFLSDMSGYVGSIAITLYNLFSTGPISYMQTFLAATIVTGAICFATLLPVFLYFQCRKDPAKRYVSLAQAARAATTTASADEAPLAAGAGAGDGGGDGTRVMHDYATLDSGGAERRGNSAGDA